MKTDNRKFIAITLGLACIVSATAAHALDEVYSPNVEYREISVEYNGSRTFDSDSSINNAQSHEVAIEAGLTPRWEVEVSNGFAKDPDQRVKFDEFEIENRFQFFESGENWMDSGMLVAYDFAEQKQDPDTLEVKLLLQKDIGLVTNTANIGFEQGVGKYNEGGPDYVGLWNTRYRYSVNFQPGVEIQSDLGQGKTTGNFNEQQDYVGPAMYGEILPDLKYQVAYLFGASDAASHSAGRILFEYEMHF